MAIDVSKAERGWRMAEAQGSDAPIGESAKFGVAGGGSTNTNQGGTGTFPIDGAGGEPPAAGAGESPPAEPEP